MKGPLRRVGFAGSLTANAVLGVRHPLSPTERLSGVRDWLNPADGCQPASPK